MHRVASLCCCGLGKTPSVCGLSRASRCDAFPMCLGAIKRFARTGSVTLGGAHHRLEQCSLLVLFWEAQALIAPPASWGLFWPWLNLAKASFVHLAVRIFCKSDFFRQRPYIPTARTLFQRP